MRLRINIAISLVALIAICWGVRFAVAQERRRTQEFLQAKYQELNRTYFHNQLPPERIRNLAVYEVSHKCPENISHFFIIRL